MLYCSYDLSGPAYSLVRARYAREQKKLCTTMKKKPEENERSANEEKHTEQ